jgi:hypothetical protein
MSFASSFWWTKSNQFLGAAGAAVPLIAALPFSTFERTYWKIPTTHLSHGFEGIGIVRAA